MPPELITEVMYDLQRMKSQRRENMPLSTSAPQIEMTQQGKITTVADIYTSLPNYDVNDHELIFLQNTHNHDKLFSMWQQQAMTDKVLFYFSLLSHNFFRALIRGIFLIYLSHMHNG